MKLCLVYFLAISSLFSCFFTCCSSISHDSEQHHRASHHDHSQLDALPYDHVFSSLSTSPLSTSSHSSATPSSPLSLAHRTASLHSRRSVHLVHSTLNFHPSTFQQATDLFTAHAAHHHHHAFHALDDDDEEEEDEEEEQEKKQSSSWNSSTVTLNERESLTDELRHHHVIVDCQPSSSSSSPSSMKLRLPHYRHSGRFHSADADPLSSKHSRVTDSNDAKTNSPSVQVDLVNHEHLLDSHSQWLVHVKSVSPSSWSCLSSLVSPYSLGSYLPHHSFQFTAPEHVAHRLATHPLLQRAHVHPTLHSQKQKHDEISTDTNSSLSSACATVLLVTEFASEFKYDPQLVQQLTKHFHGSLLRYHKQQKFQCSPPNRRSRAPDQEDPQCSEKHDHEWTEERLLQSVDMNEEVADSAAKVTATDLHLSVVVSWPRLASSHSASSLLPASHNDTKLVRLLIQRSLLHFAPGILYTPIHNHRLTVTIPARLLLQHAASASTHRHKLKSSSSSSSSLFAPFLSSFVSFLSSHPLVSFIERRPSFRLHNKYAKYVTQMSLPSSQMYDVSVPPLFHLNGLRGDGEIVGHGDTGLDYDSCFFYDELHAVPINAINMQHRKIVMYSMLTPDPSRDVTGDYEGHGTHTGGSLAGSAIANSQTSADLTEVQYYNGMAPNAKLAVFDFEKRGDDGLYVPSDVAADFLLPHTRVGAWVSSNSWGDDSGGYDAFSRDIDSFIQQHPNFVMVVAAGNSGENGLSSVGTPAVSKNSITVGASENAAASFMEQGRGAAIQISSSSSTFSPRIVPVSPALFGHPFASQPERVNLPVVFAQPHEACSSLNNAAEVNGKVVLVDRGTCTYAIKAAMAQAAGAAFLLVINNVNENNFPMSGSSSPPLTIPSALVSLTDGAIFHSPPVGLSLSSLRVTLPVPPTPSMMNFGPHLLADFSSRGPTQDGRLKPDVVGPGQYIQSAHSTQNINDHQCSAQNGVGIEAMEGTSMATPIVAGTAALIRQYFRQGFYYPPSSSSSPAAFPFDPSSALVKAVLVQSGQSIGGVVPDKRHPGRRMSVQPAPSPYQGFGRIELDSTLTFPLSTSSSNSTPSAGTLFVQDSDALTSSDSSFEYCFDVGTDADEDGITPSFKATLVWTDPTGATSTTLQLVNNLDLIVSYFPSSSSSSPSVWIGNQGNTLIGGAGVQWDDANNVEKIEVANALPGFYRVTVRAVTLVHAPQRFALVVNGGFALTAAATACPPTILCPDNCSGHGVCPSSVPASRAAMCVCDPHYAGANCEVAVPAVPIGLSTVTVAIQSFTYFYYDAQPNDVELTFEFLKLGTGGDPDYYLSGPDLQAPTLSRYTFADTQNDAATTTAEIRTLRVSSRDIRPGRYMVGIWGYCCVDSIPVRVNVTVTSVPTTAAPSTVPPTTISVSTAAPSDTPSTNTTAATTAATTSVTPSSSMTSSIPSTTPSTSAVPISPTNLATTNIPSSPSSATPKLEPAGFVSNLVLNYAFSSLPSRSVFDAAFTSEVALLYAQIAATNPSIRVTVNSVMNEDTGELLLYDFQPHASSSFSSSPFSSSTIELESANRVVVSFYFVVIVPSSSTQTPTRALPSVDAVWAALSSVLLSSSASSSSLLSSYRYLSVVASSASSSSSSSSYSVSFSTVMLQHCVDDDVYRVDCMNVVTTLAPVKSVSPSSSSSILQSDAFKLGVSIGVVAFVLLLVVIIFAACYRYDRCTCSLFTRRARFVKLTDFNAGKHNRQAELDNTNNNNNFNNVQNNSDAEENNNEAKKNNKTNKMNVNSTVVRSNNEEDEDEMMSGEQSSSNDHVVEHEMVMMSSRNFTMNPHEQKFTVDHDDNDDDAHPHDPDSHRLHNNNNNTDIDDMNNENEVNLEEEYEREYREGAMNSEGVGLEMDDGHLVNDQLHGQHDEDQEGITYKYI